MSPNPLAHLADVLEALAQTLREWPALATPQPTPAPTPAESPWLTIRQFSIRHPSFPLNTVKNLVSARAANGLLAQGIVKEVLQRKIIVHEARLLAWLLREPELHIVPPQNRRRSHA